MMWRFWSDPSESKNVIADHPKVAVDLPKAWKERFPIGGDPIAWKPEYFEQLKAIR